MKQKTTTEFIIEAKLKFGDKFDYNCFNYYGSKIKIKIKCPIHGAFLQTPEHHLMSKFGCRACAVDNLNKQNKTRDYSKRVKQPMSKETFLKKTISKYGSKFVLDLTNYNGVTGEKIKVTCPVHGSFLIKPKHFLSKGNQYGCNKCSIKESSIKRTHSYQDILRKCNVLFADTYTYLDSNKESYKNVSSIIDINCPSHGCFKLSAQRHLNGHACHQCKIEEMSNNGILVGGYSESFFVENPELKSTDAYLYYLKINDGQYYKIGISRVSVSNRIKCLRSKAKKYNERLKIEVLVTSKGNLYSLFQKEQKILEEFKTHRVYRRWSTELFKDDILSNIKYRFLTDL